MSRGGDDPVTGGATTAGAGVADLALSEMAGRYVLETRLGAGGMGEVWAAYDRQLDRKVALKFLHTRDQAVASRLLDEARAQARIDHPRIRKVFEVGKLDGRPYIAMQLLAGETLAKAAPTLSFAARMHVMVDATRALAVAHAAGLLHLDLKPANLFVESGGDPERPVVWIMDFGLARRAGQAPTGEVRGTPRYMAPEQLRGQSDQFGPPTDVYGLGVTLFEVLTGKTPREMDTSRVTTSTTQSLPSTPDAAPPTSAFVLPRKTSLDPIVRAIIERCLQPARAERYASCQALADDLERYLAGDPVDAMAERPLPKRWRLARAWEAKRKRIVQGAGAIAVLALGVWGGVALFDARRLAQATERFSREANDAESRMRLGHVRPVHDLSDEESHVQRWNEQLRAELPTLREAEQPPAALALGRSWLLLDDPAAAQRVLAPLWERGHRTPAVALALGSALARRYEAERAALEPLAKEGHSQRAEDRLAAEWRNPALAMLRHAASTGNAEQADLIAGEIALLEERYDEALQQAQRALARNATLYDAFVLIGRVRHAQAREAYLKDQLTQAGTALTEARRAVAAAIEHARSYPPAYVLHCRLAYLQINLDYWGSGHLDLVRAANDLELCRTAVIVAPHDAAALEWTARLGYKIGRASRDRNLPATPLLLASALNAESACAQKSAQGGAWDALANAWSELAAALNAEGRDVGAMYERALAAGKLASKRSPSNAVYLYDHALTLSEYADWKNIRGQDPRGALTQGIEALRRAVEIDPTQMVRLALVELHVQLAAADNAMGSPADAPLQNAWAALRDAYPQPADTSLYHAIAAELLSESARVDWERGRDPLVALTEQLAHLKRCRELSPDEPSYRVLEAVARQLVAERNWFYHGTPLPDLRELAALLAARPKEANDILWPQTVLQAALNEADYLTQATPTASIAAIVARGRAGYVAARAQNPNDSEVIILGAQLDLVDARGKSGAARTTLLRSAERALRTTLERNPRPLHGWVVLAESQRLLANETNGATRTEAFAAAERSLATAEQQAPDHPRLVAERAALAYARATDGAARAESRRLLDAALAKNRHLALRYRWLDRALVARRD